MYLCFCQQFYWQFATIFKPKLQKLYENSKISQHFPEKDRCREIFKRRSFKLTTTFQPVANVTPMSSDTRSLVRETAEITMRVREQELYLCGKEVR